MELNRGTVVGGSVVEPPKDAPRLRDLGISNASSSRWQSVAAIPEDQFESYIAAAKDAEAELTSKGIQTFAKSLRKEGFESSCQKIKRSRRPHN